MQLTHNTDIFPSVELSTNHSSKFYSNTFYNKSIKIKKISKPVKAVKYEAKFQAIKLAHLIPLAILALLLYTEPPEEISTTPQFRLSHHIILSD